MGPDRVKLFSGHLLDELQFLPIWQKPPFEPPPEKASNGLTPGRTVIERPMVDIHADKLIGQLKPHIAGVLQCMPQSVCPMI